MGASGAEWLATCLECPGMSSITLQTLQLHVKKLEQDLVLLQKLEEEARRKLEDKNNFVGWVFLPIEQQSHEEEYQNAAMKVLEFDSMFELEKEKLDLCEKVYSEACDQ